MCGFVGAFRIGPGDAPVEASVLTAMRDTMTHRGPDSAGQWVASDRRVGLAHRRLAIVDLSPAGAQPMVSPVGGSVIAFNGEIYNHAELRPGLEAAGRRFTGRSDTETLLHALEVEGERALGSLDGMFAFAWWDPNRRRLLLVRDRLGIKPCYVACAGGFLLFASEIKALLAHPAVVRDVEPIALSHYLTFMAAPAPWTLFRGIWKLPAGHLLWADAQGRIAVSKWWQPIVPTAEPPPSEADAAVRVRELLEASIKRQMMSDVPFGVFLSGGIDSTTNAALMKKHMPGPVRTFTVAFRDHAAYNEDAPARAAAKALGTEHHEVVIGEDEAIGFCEELPFFQDEPLADWVCLPLYFVSRLVRQSGTIMVQVGEGSDELFAGYDHYRLAWERYERSWRKLRAVPSPLLAVAGYAARRASLGSRWHRRGELLRRAARRQEFFWGGAIAWVDDWKDALVRPGPAWTPGPRGTGPFDPPPHDTLDSAAVPAHYVRQIRGAKPGADFLERLIHIELSQRLPELLLMRVDKMAMATSVEGRVPFLDHHLVEYVLSLPSRYKVRDGVGKRVLKQAVRGLVPDDVIDRPKQGFGAPVTEWLRTRMGEFAAERWRRSLLRARGFFNDELVDRLIAEHRAGTADHALRIWTVLNLVLWYDRWIAR